MGSSVVTQGYCVCSDLPWKRSEKHLDCSSSPPVSNLPSFFQAWGGGKEEILKVPWTTREKCIAMQPADYQERDHRTAGRRDVGLHWWPLSELQLHVSAGMSSLLWSQCSPTWESCELTYTLDDDGCDAFIQNNYCNMLFLIATSSQEQYWFSMGTIEVDDHVAAIQMALMQRPAWNAAEVARNLVECVTFRKTNYLKRDLRLTQSSETGIKLWNLYWKLRRQ